MSLFSHHWYRVRNLRPRLRRTCEISRQVFRDETWYVVRGVGSNQFFRLSPEAYSVVGLLDGRTTMENIWRKAAADLGDRMPTQDRIIGLLHQLNQLDLLIVDAPSSVDELVRRGRKLNRKHLLRRVKSPFSISFPLFDPDSFLERWKHVVNPLFSVWGFVGWCALIAYAVVLAALNWPELSTNFADRLFSQNNIILVILIYPVIKAFHELGHAFAVKRWGGEVSEIGIMLLVLMPVPYVDATAATGWPEKWRRIVVGAMGIIVELTLAALALIVWVSVEPGLVSAIAFAVILIGGISTLLFNGNPLLRFDGYYVFADFLEIPNLSKRSFDYLAYLAKRYLFGMRSASSPVAGAGERAWFVTYAVSAFTYRVLLVAGIILLVAQWFFALGLLLAVLAIIQLAIWPAGRIAWFLAFNRGLDRHRSRALAVTAAILLAIVGLVGFVPLPYATVAQGIVWTGDGARVVAGTTGFATKVDAVAGATVSAGAPIAKLQNEELSTRLERLEQERRSIVARLNESRVLSQAASQQLRQRLAAIEAARADLRRQVDTLVISSPRNGIFVPDNNTELQGQFFRKGAQLGRVVNRDDPVVLRVAVPDGDAELVRGQTAGVTVRFAHAPHVEHKARLVRSIPAANDRLPSPALSTLGGGPFAIDPTRADQLGTLEKVYIFETAVEGQVPNEYIGARAFVRFDHGTAPLAIQVARPLRQLILKQLRF